MITTDSVSGDIEENFVGVHLQSWVPPFKANALLSLKYSLNLESDSYELSHEAGDHLTDGENPRDVNVDKDFHIISNLQRWRWFVLLNDKTSLCCFYWFPAKTRLQVLHWIDMDNLTRSFVSLVVAISFLIAPALKSSQPLENITEIEVSLL